jgi:hypothetical protein
MIARRVVQGRSRGAHRTVEGLRRWVVSLPWVVELPRAGATDPLRFAVDCPPSDCNAVWLLFDPVGDRRTPPTIIVTLPAAVARRGVAAGWAVDITDLGDGRQAVAVATPATGDQFRALQALVVLSYTSTFEHAGSPEPS